jgi:putative Mn2+ efflux pump MntP
MDIITPLLIGIGLSMDCFAVSLALGTTTKSHLLSVAAYVALFFGAFQGGDDDCWLDCRSCIS